MEGMMLSRYHVEMTTQAIGAFFTPASLREITRANVGQDSLPSMFGVDAHRHVCDCTVSDSFDYINEEHAFIAELAQTPGHESIQRAALGRLLHTVQDFYAHTNYITLWLAEKGSAERVDATGMDGLDPHILTHPSLQIAQWLTWREPFYYVPGVGHLLRWFWLPAQSHEAINLDSPSRGSHFHLATAVACQRTRAEYARAVKAIRRVGGALAVARFHGMPNNAVINTPTLPVPSKHLVEA
jgi:hypothetical protein